MSRPWLQFQHSDKPTHSIVYHIWTNMVNHVNQFQQIYTFSEYYIYKPHGPKRPKQKTSFAGSRYIIHNWIQCIERIYWIACRFFFQLPRHSRVVGRRPPCRSTPADMAWPLIIVHQGVQHVLSIRVQIHLRFKPVNESRMSFWLCDASWGLMFFHEGIYSRSIEQKSQAFHVDRSESEIWLETKSCCICCNKGRPKTKVEDPTLLGCR